MKTNLKHYFLGLAVLGLLTSCGGAPAASQPITPTSEPAQQTSEPAAPTSEPTAPTSEPTLTTSEPSTSELIVSDDPYRPEIKEITVHGYRENHDTVIKPFKLSVKEGDDLSSSLGLCTMERETGTTYLEGFYTNAECTRRLRASQVASFDCRFTDVYMRYEPIADNPVFYKRYFGTYENHFGDSLTWGEDGLAFDLKIDEEHKVRIEASDFGFNDHDVYPIASTLKVNGTPIESKYGLPIGVEASDTVQYSEDWQAWSDAYPNLLKKTVFPFNNDNSAMMTLINSYYEGIGSDFRIPSNNDYDVFITSHFSANNDVTIAYDL